MKNRIQLLVLASVLMSAGILASGIFSGSSQDFIISGDIAGSSSVFSFPKSRKAPKRYTASTKSASVKRSRSQRAATRTKIRKQYDRLDRVASRRNKIEIIKPEDLIPREDPEKASLALTGAAQYYFNEDQVDKSIDYYRESYKLNNKNDFARLGLSDALTRKGDDLMSSEESPAAIAERFYLEAIELNVENSAAYAGLGEVYDQLEKPEKAIENYEKALKIDPDLTDVSAPLGILYYRAGDIAKADIFLKKALESEPDDAQTQYFLGLVKLSQNRFAEAETAFKKSIQLDPGFSEGYYGLGTALSKLAREKEAIDEYNLAIKTNPKYTEAWFDLGSAYFNTEDYQKSVDAYLEAIKLRNNDPEAYINLADSYRQLADNDSTVKGKYALLGQALSRYSTGLTLIQNNPNNREEFTDDELAEIFSRYGYTAGERNMLASVQGITHNWDRALEALTTAAEMKNDALDYANLGWAFYNSARNDLKANPDAARQKLMSAKENLDKAEKLKPNPVIMTAIKLNKGITAIDLGEFSSAVENLKPVTGSRPDWAFANYSLGVAYFKGGDLNNAISQFKKAVEKETDYVAAYSGLGNAYLLKNDLKAVRGVIEDLKKIKSAAAINEANRLQFALSLKN